VKIKFFAVLALMFALGGTYLPATATLPAESLKEKIKDAGEDLDSANEKVSKALSKYNRAASALPAAEAKLKRAKAALAAAKAADAKASKELRNVTIQSDLAEMTLEETKSAISQQETEVTILVRALYREGPMSEMAIVLGSDTPEDFTARIETISTWHDSKLDLINSLVKAKEDLNLQAAQLAALEAKKAKKKATAEEQVLTAAQATYAAEMAQKQVDRLVRERSAALAIARKYQSEVKSRYDALKKKQEKLRKAAQDAANNDGDLSGNGNLLWPVSGASRPSGAQVAGWRTHPVYGYRSCHTGIDLGAPSGTSIKAAEDGRVASVGYDNIYGNYTLIAHGDGMTTFYAHQLSKSVKKGDSVKRGETIGKVGSTGWSTGPHLHWEVRIDGDPWDPMGWFGNKKQKIACAN
jgi:murein DD-endopeptidase MepM/ murein hydrolase activator NlpD